jgi:hypothetical protein
MVMLLLTAMTVAAGASRTLPVIAVGPVFDQINYKKIEKTIIVATNMKIISII